MASEKRYNDTYPDREHGSAPQTSTPRHSFSIHFPHLDNMTKIASRQARTAEEKIQHVITALDMDPCLAISATGRKYGIPKPTLANRFRGSTIFRKEDHIHRQLLSPAEEKAVERWIN